MRFAPCEWLLSAGHLQLSVVAALAVVAASKNLLKSVVSDGHCVHGEVNIIRAGLRDWLRLTRFGGDSPVPALQTHCARSFGMRSRLKAAQLNRNSQSTFSKPRSFTFRNGPVCLSHPNAFSTSQRLLRLISYPR